MKKLFIATVATKNNRYAPGTYEAESEAEVRRIIEGIAPQWRDGPAISIDIVELGAAPDELKPS